MSRKEKIQVHSMDDWFSGVYMKPCGGEKFSVPDYEISEPHRHDFYYFVLLDKGSMELEFDFEKVRLTDQSLFLSYPGQVYKIVSTQTEQGFFWLLTHLYLICNLEMSLISACQKQYLLPYRLHNR